MHAEAFPRQAPLGQDDLWRPVLLALGVHLLVALLFLLAWWWSPSRSMQPAAGSPMVEAALMISTADIRSAEQAVRDAPKPEPLPAPVQEIAEEETVPPPQPIPEPRPQDSPVQQQPQAQERIPVPDTTEQDRASALAISQEKARQEQEERRRQEQIDLTERERQQEAERKQRLAKQQEEQDRQNKLDEIRRQRAQAQREAQLAEQKLRQLADARERATPAPATTAQSRTQDSAGSGPSSGPSQGEWVSAMVAAIERQWIRPTNISPGMICPIRIRMLPGGEVMSAEVEPGCPYDEAARDSVERAVRKASPLPYTGFERVAARDFVVRFQPSR